MSKYIDADRMKRQLENSTYRAKNKFIELINEQDPADVVEVVRCEDCKYHENEMPGMVYCPAVVGGWVDADWFCKGGERRDD